MLLQFVGRLKTWAVFSQTPVRSCSVIPPSLSIMHDSTRAMRVCVLSTSKKVSAQWTTRPLETVMSFGVKMNCFLCVVHQLCSVSSKRMMRVCAIRFKATQPTKMPLGTRIPTTVFGDSEETGNQGHPYLPHRTPMGASPCAGSVSWPQCFPWPNYGLTMA